MEDRFEAKIVGKHEVALFDDEVSEEDPVEVFDSEGVIHEVNVVVHDDDDAGIEVELQVYFKVGQDYDWESFFYTV